MAGDNNVCSGVSEAAEKDLYAVLGASPSDSFHELRHRYQKLALQCHPDRLGDVCDSEAESGMRMFLEIDAAWRILSDHSARRQYDQERRAQQLKQDWLVDSTVSVEDMTWNEGHQSSSFPALVANCFHHRRGFSRSGFSLAISLALTPH
ncbi:dnaJ homolog subfamily C member 24 isoform X2 [Dunckerocampus dactyliophorus]|uniref:dnaJ homolog subfamily C member 24 isoform X2 n=1 Tax=Dunckerocampus dactyliophorus TaxID=161453 RepID=UPI0024056C3D|nr:dnaJ homolog subfamily C member 24 isoform X2 [Dunckerocampus dactyliophorus]